MSRPVLIRPGFNAPGFGEFVDEVSAHPMFDPARAVVVARAPGRLDLMGGIADYSGSLVLQWPLREATYVALQTSGDGRLQATSLGASGEPARVADMAVTDLFPPGGPLDWEEARAWFAARPDIGWSAYVFGCLLALVREKGVSPPRGLRLLVRSTVPEGKGVSSSAALEVATMQALAATFGVTMDPRELALLAQKVENRVVGAACGVMDQMTAACGGSDQLLALLCQPAELEGTVAMPEDLEVWGLDSGVRHAVSGSDYGSVRTAAFMGARVLAERAGLHVMPGDAPGRVAIMDLRWGGHLANATPSELAGFEALPESLTGSEFLARYGGITDDVTRVEPERVYAVRACASHPIHEHFRVRAFAAVLHNPADPARDLLLGELMYQSHASYSACGLGSEATDLLVALVREAGPQRGFFGAKITGGGSGGTVAVLGRRDSDIGEIVAAFEARTGRALHVFSGSSSGAAAFGAARLGSR
jgi:galactokinase